MNKGPVVSKHDVNEYSYRNYVIGFVLSVSLTLIAYVITANHLFAKDGVLVSIFTLALIQFMVQSYYFLHLGREARPRWKLAAFYFMLLIVGILVIGSIWIMTHLNYHMHMQDNGQGFSKEEGL